MGEQKQAALTRDDISKLATIMAQKLKSKASLYGHKKDFWALIGNFEKLADDACLHPNKKNKTGYKFNELVKRSFALSREANNYKI